MMENGKDYTEKESEFRYGLMELNMKENLRIIKLTGGVDLFMQMGTFMMAIG